MDRKTTERLEKILNSTDNEDTLKEYIHTVEQSDPYRSFIDYYLSLDKVQNTEKMDLCRSSGLERSYFYHIMDGSKNPGRDKILCLCIAAGLNSTEVRKALEAGREAPLYARDKRDAVIFYAVINSYSLMKTNELLDSFDMEPLL